MTKSAVGKMGLLIAAVRFADVACDHWFNVCANGVKRTDCLLWKQVPT